MYWIGVKVRTFFRDTFHRFFSWACISFTTPALSTFCSEQALKPQDSPPKPSCDSPGRVSRSWAMFYNFVPLHWVPKSVFGECGGCWGCSPNPTDLPWFPHSRQNVLLSLFFSIDHGPELLGWDDLCWNEQWDWRTLSFSVRICWRIRADFLRLLMYKTF